MIEVPGMTSEALAAMPPQPLAALRLGLYARAVAPALARDLDAIEQELGDQDRPPTPVTLRHRRSKAREAIARARIAQQAVRELLLLDDEDD